MDWSIIDKEVNKYTEWFLLPNLIAFIIYRTYLNNMKFDCSYIVLYNTLKTYINIVDENTYLIYRIVLDILKNKYQLKLINLNPLIVSEI